jgi:hypothetical protein
MLKHHCSAFFSPFHHLFHPPSSTKQFRPAIVSPLFVLKHHCSEFLIPFPSSFSPPHQQNNSVQQLFRLFAETPSFSTSFIHNAETPSFSTL